MKFRAIIQLVALALVSSGAAAQNISNDGYARDMSGDVVKNPFGLCWHSSQWTDAKAIADCDPDSMPRPAPRVVRHWQGGAQARRPGEARPAGRAPEGRELRLDHRHRPHR